MEVAIRNRDAPQVIRQLKRGTLCAEATRTGQVWLERKLRGELQSWSPDYDDLSKYLRWLADMNAMDVIDTQLVQQTYSAMDRLVEDAMYRVLASGSFDFRVPTFFLLGRPGAGKTTVIGSAALQQLGCHVVSVGDLGRSCVGRQDCIGQRLLQQNQLLGQPEDADLMLDLLEDHLKARHRQRALSCVVIDGFPRNLELLMEWEDELSDRFGVLAAINLNVSRATSLQRVVSRAARAEQRRADDAIAARRNDVYDHDTTAVLGLFDMHDALLDVDGNMNADEIATEIAELISERMNTFAERQAHDDF